MAAARRYRVAADDESRELVVADAAQGALAIADAGGAAVEVSLASGSGAIRTVTVAGRRFDFGVVLAGGQYHLVIDGYTHTVSVADARAAAARTAGGAEATGVSSRRLVAPIPGRVVRISVAQGDRVERGQPILVLDAMKLENELVAPRAGVVARLAAQPGQAVEKGQLLVELRGMTERIDHIGIAVRSIAEVLPFYRDGLGLAPGHTEDVAGMGVRVVKLPIGESTIELIEGTDPAGVIAKFVASRGPGIHHVCLEVADLDAATARLRGLGYSPVFDQPRTGAGGHRVNFLKPADAGGVLYELVERVGAAGH